MIGPGRGLDLWRPVHEENGWCLIYWRSRPASLTWVTALAGPFGGAGRQVDPAGGGRDREGPSPGQETEIASREHHTARALRRAATQLLGSGCRRWSVGRGCWQSGGFVMAVLEPIDFDLMCAWPDVPLTGREREAALLRADGLHGQRLGQVRGDVPEKLFEAVVSVLI